MKLHLAALALLAASSTYALADARIAPAAAAKVDAAKVCQTAQGDVFGHPSNACWAAYHVALAKQDYADALGQIRVGCDKYKRSDYCTFLSFITRQPAQVVPVTTDAEKKRLRDAMWRAARYVTPVDVEDGESGALFSQAGAGSGGRK